MEKNTNLTTEKLKDLAVVGSRWRLRGNAVIEAHDGSQDVRLTRDNIAILVEDDFECSFVSLVFMSPDGEKALIMLDGCVEKFLAADFEPVDVENSRTLRTAMQCYWHEKYLREEEEEDEDSYEWEESDASDKFDEAA